MKFENENKLQVTTKIDIKMKLAGQPDVEGGSTRIRRNKERFIRRRKRVIGTQSSGEEELVEGG